MIDIAIAERYSDLPKKETWINEAKFGFEQVRPYLDRLPDQSKVLEVGSGSGILLSQMQAVYPRIRFEGIEPLGDGFESLKPYHEKLERDGIRLNHCGYEDFQSDETYDLIFLVNVFEHLPDWTDFLKFVKARLSQNGLCVILCPNYGFPYESHFGVPVVLNKTITYKIFGRTIDRFERNHDCRGLWRSLNFIKHAQLRRECSKLGLSHKFRPDVIVDMIDRLDTDNAFKSRQKGIYWVARLVKKSGALNLLKIPLIQDISPYMKIELRLQQI